MNYSIKRGLLVMACSIGVGLSQSSVAAPDIATATIDWSNLQLSVTGIGDTTPSVVFSGQNTSLSSNAFSSGLPEISSKNVNNWTATAETTAEAGTTSANALASPLSFSGNANAENGLADSFGSRTVNFSLDGPAVLTVSVPYTISLTGDPFDGSCCFSFDQASVSGFANFSSSAGNASYNSNASFSLNSLSSSSPQSQSGTLLFGIFASDAGSGSLGVNFDLATQDNVNPIPEPESYAMLLAGLGLVGAVVRRRRMNRNETPEFAFTLRTCFTQ